MPILTNPLGLWALLSIPAILAIHFLQKKAKRVPLATRFLLEQNEKTTRTGSRFTRLISSIALWLQILCALCLTWLLCAPSYRRANYVQRIGVVLDSSASMQAFREKSLAELAKKIPKLQGNASSSEIIIWESDLQQAPIYRGFSFSDAQKACQTWMPRSGEINPEPALQLARNLIGPTGTLVYVTDTPLKSPPAQLAQLSVAKPIDNVGIAGIEISSENQTDTWSATIRNTSASPQTRQWWIETPQGKTAPKSITLPANGIYTLSSEFSSKQNRFTLHLSPDSFSLDDAAPIIRAQKPELVVCSQPQFQTNEETNQAQQDFISRFVPMISPAQTMANPALADLTFLHGDEKSIPPTAKHAVVFPFIKKSELQTAPITPADHPFVRDLPWSTLIVSSKPEFLAQAQDTVLLYQGKNPLIFLRPRGNTQDLFVNFSLQYSNATTQPSFILLLYRFAESIREQKPVARVLQLETHQSISLPATSAPKRVVEFNLQQAISHESTLAGNDSFTTSREPGFLEIHDTSAPKSTPLVSAAVSFGDSRESDFQACSPFDNLSQIQGAQQRTQPQNDPWWRAFVLLVLLALLASWFSQAQRPT